MHKVALVLEGGGMRGAYTAGALAWLVDNGYHFHDATAISTGAVHLCTFLKGDTTLLHDLSCEVLSRKRCIGIQSVLHEGRIVAFDYVFDQVLAKEKNYTLEKVTDSDTNVAIGLYDLENSKTTYHGNSEITLKLLKAACSLPIISKIVRIDDKPYLDGGITKMVPIEQAMEMDSDRYLIICTKPVGYVRKKSKIVAWLMRLFYPKYKGMADDYSIRDVNYNKQMKIIYDLEEKGEALLVQPQINLPVKRLSGDRENLEKLYALAYKEMEDNREKIDELFGK